MVSDMARFMDKTLQEAYEIGRKEVAREIFEEIKKCTTMKVLLNGEIIYDKTKEFDELKKKYTEGE